MARSARRYLSLGMGMIWAASTAAVETPFRDDALLDLSLDDLINIPVSTGVRFEGHTRMTSSLSVVSFSSEELRAPHGGSADLNMVLRDLVPSFNYLTEPLNDGSSHVRGFSLRGLPPDETLVLINGKRFHRSALVQVGVGSPITLGSQGADLAQLPAFGLKRVEVLRDGASAQYGSDAIAGVINLSLSERAEGGEVQVQRGTTGAGLSSQTRVALNTGMRLGARGFFNLTTELVQQDEVSRGGQRPDAAYYASQGLEVANPAQVWGSPVLDTRRLLWNARMDLQHGTQAYMFGNFSDAHSDSSFNYRALTRGFFDSNLNTVNGSLVSCPGAAGDQYGYQSARACLDRAKANPALFNFQSWFPAGFTPRLASLNRDVSEVLGVNGDMRSGGTFDLSFSYARDRIDFRLNRTINPSLGPASPTAFALGALAQTERNLNADFVWPLTPQLSLAAGAEWRQETYASQAGEPASWEAGPYSILGIGSNGMPGIDPAAAGRFARRNLSVYADSEYHLGDALLVSGAGRYEHYSDFGNAFSHKFSLRYLVSEKLTVRGALGTGFRAPSPGQSHLTNIGHNAGNSGATVQVVGIIPPSSEIARFFGAQPLQPEFSRNVSLGTSYRHQALSLTLDAFRIKVKDRIELSNALTLTDELRSRMRAAGIANSDEYDTIVVFNNAADSVSQGLDMSAVYGLESSAGTTELKADLSRVNTQVQPNGHGFVLSEQTRYNLANQIPRTRAGLNVRHLSGAWRLTAGTVWYGPFSVHDGLAATRYSSKLVANVEAGFVPRSGKGWGATAGIGNLFDTQAHRQDNSSIGSPFISENPFEYQGRNVYASAKYSF